MSYVRQQLLLHSSLKSKKQSKESNSSQRSRRHRGEMRASAFMVPCGPLLSSFLALMLVVFFGVRIDSSPSLEPCLAGGVTLELHEVGEGRVCVHMGP